MVALVSDTIGDKMYKKIAHWYYALKIRYVRDLNFKYLFNP
ncbi:hypothetical protein BACOVA_04654 [Bacteroides ovatus ATCC 8483]|uniref:Uncharacterized protein n=1 Tax=Bacteroides ovatus (strain ATCC 8483 / DSM 1896 / JCM 5824 / BCRC 10623 / CCUG 4943 / NCTC 11153) TaxID=411476 RepID=A0AAN3A2V6_BACO1|nr:hypothetical protein BACOVA_04654 [Bacteroides ovatus ATCC 8483]